MEYKKKQLKFENNGFKRVLTIKRQIYYTCMGPYVNGKII